MGGGGGGGNLAKLEKLLKQLGGGGGSDMAGMMVIASLIGAQMASGAKPGSSTDPTSEATGGTSSDGPGIYFW